jgi:hypothetical protein
MNENQLAKPQQRNVVVAPEDLPDLDSMEEGLPVQAQYMEFTEAGEIERGILCGWSEMASKKGGTIPVAMWQNARGIFANAGANLTQQLQRVNLGQAIQIMFKGAVKTKSGNNCKVFEVKLLTPKGQKQDVSTVPLTKPVERKENVLDRGRVDISKDVPEEHQEFDPGEDEAPSSGELGPPPDEMSKDGNVCTITMNKTNLLGGTTKDGEIWWGVELPTDRPSITWKTSDGNLLTAAAQQNKRVVLQLDPAPRRDGGRNILSVKVL